MYWMFDPLTEAFQSVPVLPEYASIITCPDGVGFSFLNGLTANGISYQYACSAGNLIARIPLQKISSYIFHALSIPVNGILSHITNVQITPEHTIMGIAAAAAITGIAFKAGYYAYNKKRKREPDEVDESITDASAVSAELDNQASQSKRPRASRPTRAT
ncbi:putative membrane protein [Emiliania huxleyi virus 18]|nr:putative membrane protein [Emiliania huxleyi virus 18]